MDLWHVTKLTHGYKLYDPQLHDQADSRMLSIGVPALAAALVEGALSAVNCVNTKILQY